MAERMSPTVLVEDILSAIKVSIVGKQLERPVNAVAILGTHMTDTMAQEIRSKSSDIMFMLDNDAITKAAELVKKYSLLFNSTRIIFPDRDPKDTSYSELLELLK